MVKPPKNKSSLHQAIENILSWLTNISTSPGIYQMYNDKEEILYIGKAKNLKKRLSNYTHIERLPYRIKNMVAQITSIKTTTTHTEAEALLLEANLIKKHKPPYNILLKDDKSYPYILITTPHPFPRITKHRGKHTIQGKYYGPFASTYAVNQTIADLQKTFLIRPCTDNFFATRTRPCLEYQIHRCSAPCVGKISQHDYQASIKQTVAFLSGKSRNLQEELMAHMEKSSAQQKYEEAAIYRNRIQALNHIQAKQDIYIPTVQNADIFGIYQQANHSCIEVLFFRNGHNHGNQHFFLAHTSDAQKEEILDAFLPQFYQKNLPPEMIMLSFSVPNQPILEEAFSLLAGHSVTISIPQKGKKKQLIEHTEKQAKSHLQQKISEHLTYEQMLAEMQKVFSLPKKPQRVEVYDNSHMSGKHTLGVMVVFDKNGFNKKAYRRFNLKDTTIQGNDDYNMMHHMLDRRLKKLTEEDTSLPHNTSWPDLLLIDGGSGHMHIVHDLVKQYDLEDRIWVAGIAKGKQRNAGNEQFHLPNTPAFTLARNAPIMHFLQILRDEAHRFAIGTYRKKHNKSLTTSLLEEIPAIGNTRKKNLLRHFGSLASVQNAAIADLVKVPGINAEIAQKIYHYFH